jgi:hypothetical protein
MKPRLLSRLLGVKGELESDLEGVRVAQEDTGRKLDAALGAQREAERRLRIVEARVGIATRRP